MLKNILIDEQRHDHIAEPLWSPLFEQFTDLTLLVDSTFTIFKKNMVWNEFVHSTQKLQSLYPWIYPEDISILRNALYQEISTHILLRLIDAEHQLYWFDILVQPLRLAQQSTVYFLLICHDQTAQIKENSQVAAQQRSLNDLITRLPLVIYRSRNDWDWSMDYISSGIEKLTGFAPQYFLNTPYYGKIVHPEDQQYVWENIQYALQRKIIFNIKYRVLYNNQHEKVIQDIGQGIYSESDMILGIAGMIIGID